MVLFVLFLFSTISELHHHTDPGSNLAGICRAGFLLSIWSMFQISPLYTIASYSIIIIIYLVIEHDNHHQKGVVNIFKGALFQLNRSIQVYVQNNNIHKDQEEWRPSAVCISPHSFERDKVLSLMKWISYKHGFGTYFHFIEGYYSRQTHLESKEILAVN